jgi:hypothetical protein
MKSTGFTVLAEGVETTAAAAAGFSVDLVSRFVGSGSTTVGCAGGVWGAAAGCGVSCRWQASRSRAAVNRTRQRSGQEVIVYFRCKGQGEVWVRAVRITLTIILCR